MKNVVYNVLNKLPKVYIALVFAFIYLPILCVAALSFNQARNGASWGGFTLDWYVQMAADNNLTDALAISLQVAVAASVLAACVGTLGAVTVMRSRKGGNITNGLMYLPLVLPEIILGIAFMMVFSVLPFSLGRMALVLTHSAFCAPFVYLLVSIRLKAADKSVFEAARDLGAEKRQVFFTITLPLVLPAILSGTLISIAMSLDDFIISYFVADPYSETLPIRIFSMIKKPEVSRKINALCTLMFAVAFVIAGIMRQTIMVKKNRGME